MPASAQEVVPTFGGAVHFKTRSSTQPNGYPFGIAAADVWDDPTGGFPEIAVANGSYDLVSREDKGEPGTVRIFRNKGTWNNASTALEVLQTIDDFGSARPAEVAFGDIDNDGDQDLIVSCGLSGGGTYVYRNEGGNNPFKRFPPNSSYDTGPVRGLALADFNNDGYLDIAASRDIEAYGTDTQADRLFVLLNDGESSPGTYAVQPEIDLGFEGLLPPSPGDILAANFNRTSGAAKIDLVSGNFDTASEGSPRISVLTNTGTQPLTFSQTDRYAHPCQTTEWAFFDMATARFRSGVLNFDIAGTPSLGRVDMLRGSGQGNFSQACTDVYDIMYTGSGECLQILPPNMVVTETFAGLAVGHLNGGTKPDVVVCLPAGNQSRVGFMLGIGDGTFQLFPDQCIYFPLVDVVDQYVEANWPIQVLIVDVDQDGFGDIVTSNHRSDTISVLVNSLQPVPGP